jgi:drug/metabolite transporter (DMT)-like permease|nr:DMT family transporter [Candidatus Krumholzibacteria bacterium]
MQQTIDQGKVRLALITIQVLFGINYLASKVVVTAMSPGGWAALRTLGAFVILAGIVLIGRRRLPSWRDSLLLGVAAFFGVVLNQGLFLEGLSRTTVGRSALICSLIPTFVLLFSWMLRQETITLRKALGFAAGLTGVLVLLEADRFRFDGRYLTGDLMTLANAASYGFFIVFSRRIMARNDAWAATAVVFFFGAAGMGIYGGADLLRTPAAVFTPAMLGIMAYVIVGATVATYFLNLWAVKRVQASRVAIFIFLQPLIAVVLGVTFRGEELTVRFLIATALVFVALLLRDGRPKESA